LAWLVVIGLGIVAYFIFWPHPPTVAELIGEWRCTNRPWTIRFGEHGQLSMQTIGPATGGTFQLDAQGNLRLVLNNGKRFQAKAELWNDELTLTNPDGTTTSFRRNRLALPAPRPPSPQPSPAPPPALVGRWQAVQGVRTPA
jgi:hypothetical protein